jgi:hypothetical protein
MNEDADKDKRESKESESGREYRITVSAWRFRGLVNVM